MLCLFVLCLVIYDMMNIWNYATLNINCIQEKNKQQLLKTFIWQNNIDILLLQEVNTQNLDFIGPQYDYVVNIGDRNLGTAIIYRAGLEAEQCEKHCSGRVTSMKIQGTQVINVYLPSGTNRRQERELFINKELPFFFRHRYARIIIGGDWNCVLHAKDQSGQYHPSPTLDILTKELQLVDAWELIHGNMVKYTFHRQNSASRLDRFYITRNHIKDIYRIKVLHTTFSDHDCVCMSITKNNAIPTYGRSYWKLNEALLLLPEYSAQFIRLFETLTYRANNTKLNLMEKWMRIIKPGIKNFYQTIGMVRSQEIKATINFYYQCLDELYDLHNINGNKWQDITETKTKICVLHKQIMNGVLVRARIPTVTEDERCTLYHLVKEKQHDKSRYISKLQTSDGNTITSISECIKEIEKFYRTLYSESENSQTATLNILSHVNRHLNIQQIDDLQLPITEDEIYQILEKTPKSTAPGPDGLTYKFYKEFWPLVKQYIVQLFNYILNDATIIDGFSDGIVVLLPKKNKPNLVSDYRPITLLNTDYKLYMKVIASRLKSAFQDIFEIGQTCSVPGKSILHNLVTIRDTILHYEEYPNESGALLSIDFNNAFDRVNHQYLQQVMEHLCIPNKIISSIMNIYKCACSKIQVNGYFSKRIPIKSSVRQGCPLSMFLFALSIEPLIRITHQNLNVGIQKTHPIFICRAYADDVVWLLRNIADCSKLHSILQTYCTASGARINTQKSFMIPLGNWSDTHTFNNITITRKAKILGLTVCTSFHELIETNWANTSALTRFKMFQQIHRDINIIEKVWHVNSFCLSKMWYLAQIIPLPKKYATIMERAVRHYIWKGYLYKLSQKQLNLPRSKGGLQLIAVKEKCEALLTRNIIRAYHNDSDPMDNNFWTRHRRTVNSKNSKLPPTLQEMCKLIESFPPEASSLNRKKQTKFIYKHIMRKSFQTPYIVTKYPNQRWSKTWHNIHLPNIPTAWKNTVYCYINQIIATEEKKYRHHMSESPACKHCGNVDTLKHRITNCGTAKIIWEKAKNLLSQQWPDSSINEWYQTLLTLDPPTTNNRFVKVWLASGFLHYQLTANCHKVTEFLQMLNDAYTQLKYKYRGVQMKNLEELKQLILT